MHLFDGLIYSNENELEDALYEYAKKHVDEFIDEIYEPVKFGIYEFYMSDVVKYCDEVLYKECINDYVEVLREEVDNLNGISDLDGMDEDELKCWYDAYQHIQNKVVDSKQVPLNTEMNMYMFELCKKIKERYKVLTGKDI